MGAPLGAGLGIPVRGQADVSAEVQGEAVKKWDAKRYYEDAGYAVQPDLVHIQHLMGLPAGMVAVLHSGMTEQGLWV